MELDQNLSSFFDNNNGSEGSTPKTPQRSVSVEDFVKQAAPAAQRVAARLGVPVEAVIGQWGLETGWGKSIIPGTNNLGNIKDFSGGGVAATDNMTGSRDKYRQYGSVDQFADDFTALLGQGRYGRAVGAKDAAGYFAGLKQGGYAEDPDYVTKGVQAAQMAAKALGVQPAQAQPAAQQTKATPRWAEIEQKPEYQALSREDKVRAKELYFDNYVAPLAGDKAAIYRDQFIKGTVPDDRGFMQKAGDTAKNVTAGVLKIGPTFVKGVADLANMLTGDSVDLGVSKSMTQRMDTIDEMVASDHYLKQKKGFERVMADDSKGIGDMFAYMLDNPAILVDQSITTIGSMFLPAGAAGAAAKGAKLAGAGAAAASKAAVAASIGTAAAQNAADTFSNLEKQSLEDRYKGATVSAAVSILAGIATGGGAEGAIAKRLAGDLQAGKIGLEPVKSFLKAVGKEAAQESGEEAGNIAGEAVGKLEAPSAVGAAKRTAFAGTLGGVMGGGTNLVMGNGQTPAQGAAVEPAVAPTVEPTPAAHPTVQAADAIVREMAESAGIPVETVLPQPAPAPAPAPVAAGDAVDTFAQNRLETLLDKRDGTIDADGVMQDGVPLTEAENAELSVLLSGDQGAVQSFYGLGDPGVESAPAPVQEAAVQDVAPAPVQPTPQETELERETRLEREAIQAEEDFAGMPSIEDVPFDFTPETAAYVPEPAQPGTQASETKGAEVAPAGGQDQQVEQQTASEAQPGSAIVAPDVVATEPVAKPGIQAETAQVVSEPVAAAAPPITPAKPKTEKERNQQADYADKWFGSLEKAQGFINKKRIQDTHQAVKKDGRWIIARKDDGTQAPQAQQAETQGPQEPAAAGVEVAPVVDVSKKPAPTNTSAEPVQKTGEGEQVKQDLGAMFDDVLAEEVAKDGAKKPQTEQEAKNAKAKAEFEKLMQEAEVSAAQERQQAEDQKKPTTEREAKAQRTATQAAASAAQNSAQALANAIDGLGALFGGNGRLGSGLSFDEETYAKAKPLFQAALANLGDASKDVKEAMRAVVRMVLDKFGAQAAQNMKPYVVRFIEDYQQEAAPQANAQDLYTPEGKFTVAKTLADDFIAGASFKTIVEARKRIGELIGRPIEAATELAKQADETVETAVVLAAREIIAAARKQGRPASTIYDRLLSLYNAQPNLAVRSSTSVRDQAYSTPVPLAFVASELAGVTDKTKMIESTAGNGMLAIGATTGNATVNELNPKRAAMLKAIGFEPTTKNAATETLAPAKSQDAVVINPPFGATKDAQGNTIIYEVKPNYGTREVDHAIVFKTLATMKDNGRAVLIVGGVQAENDEARREDYRGKNKRAFYANLYADYNVVDHFSVDGDMYSKQGASYPVDVIVIEGRGKSARALPAAELPAIIKSYDELKGKLNGTRSVGTEGVQRTDSAPGGEGATGPDNGTTVARVPVGPGERSGGEGGGRGNDAGMQPAGRADARQPGASGPVAGSAQPGTDTGSGPVAADGQTAVPSNGGRAKPGSQGRAGTDTQRLGGASAVDGERVGSELTDRRGQEQETATQVAYTPHSKAASVGTLVPAAMRDSIDASLQLIEDQVGGLDGYVAASLNMKPAAVKANFSAEQIDALALAIRNAEAGKGFIIGDQCVAGDTLITNPLDGSTATIKELAEAGAPILVMSLTRNGFRPTKATAPFLKGRADLYRVKMDDGSSIVVTQGHRFLTTKGWASIRSGLAVGSSLVTEFSSESVLSSYSVESSLPRDVLSSDRHLMSAAQGSQCDCLPDSHQCDAPLLVAEGNGQYALPSQAGVLEHSRCCSHEDGRAASQECSHLHPSPFLPSKSSFSQVENRDLSRFSSQVHASFEQELPTTHQGQQPFHHETALPHQEVCEVHHDQCAAKDHKLSLSSVDHSGLRIVESISFERHDDYYDMLVPGALNYVAAGVVNHNTGIGKGRVVAAMIRYALENGKVPIFVTEKPNLYSDMIRDLDDIGMTDALALDTKKPRILITNGTESIPYTLLRTKDGEITENNLTLKAPKSGKALDDLLRSMAEEGSLGEYKVVFTTYSQMQTVKGKMTERMRFVQAFADGNYMIFDESHNAGGAGETQARTKEQRQAQKEGASLTTGRASFVRGLVGKASGTFFSSATYAKRPDVMDLYSSTNMKLAVDKISQLGEAIKAGGVPMQQVVANMLTKDGQYIRRERTFAGVSYDTQETKVDKQTAENMASAMRSILAFSRAKESAVKKMQAEMDREGAVAVAMGGEKTSVQGANFGSIMHNLIDQMLLSLKAQDSVRHAIDRLKAGEKVVMTVSNTMGSFIKDYAEEMGLGLGDPMGLSFADLYTRYLEKQRMVSIKDAGGNKRQHRLTDEELGPELVTMFNDVRAQIEESGFGAAPISPIDFIHAELRKAGYKTDEITGRTVALNYDIGTPILTSRQSNIKQRVNAVRNFNAGETDVLILNQAGSTGLSLHASSKVKDKRKRHMIIVQPEKNIDTHMQMLGRVHRTGQVVPPAYSQMMADIPAEMRPAAVLMKKMASLNANTTASRKSSVTAEGVVDFMNDYGGQVVQEFLSDNPDIHKAVGGTKVIPLAEEAEDADEAIIRKFTGYVPILPIKQQEEIYTDLIARYNELLERENSLGTNKLEAKAIDLDAETVSRQELTERKADSSVFAEPAYMEQVDVKRSVKPFSSDEVKKQIAEALGGKPASDVARKQRADLDLKSAVYIKERLNKMEEADPVKVADTRTMLQMARDRVSTILNTYKIGDSISVSDKLTGVLYGVITNVSSAGRTANPAAGSDWKMTVALANGDAKSLTLSFSQIGTRYALLQETSVNWYNGETKTAEVMPVMSIFDKGAGVRREKRWMVTGNILAGFAKHPGQIITYTKKDGTTAQGVLMSRQFDFAKEQKNQPVSIKTGAEALQIMESIRTAEIGTQDGSLRIMRQSGGSRFAVTVPSSKRDGGTYYLDQEITRILGGDFYKRGQVMTATTYDADAIAQLVDYLTSEREESIVALNYAEKVKEVLGAGGRKFPDIKDARPTPMADAVKASAQKRMASLRDRLASGKITDAEYRLAVMQALAMIRREEKRAQPDDVKRGYDWVVSQLNAYAVDKKATDFAKWLLEQNPNLANDLGIDVLPAGGTSAGEYNDATRVFSLAADGVNTGTAVHEILHHTERMMPADVQAGVLKAWQKAWDKAYQQAEPTGKVALSDLMAAGLGDKKAHDRVVRFFADGTLNYADHYQLYSPSEFWAVNATDILAGRYAAQGSWVAQAKQWLGEFIQRLKGALGLSSNAPVIKALESVLNGDGQFQSPEMLVDLAGDTAPGPGRVFQDIRRKASNDAIQFFGNQAKTFNAYDRTLSTQFSKALKDKDFGRVFGLANAMQNEVSLTSIRPAEQAPGVLPRVDDFKAAARQLIKGKKADPMLEKAANAIFAGTLDGANVLEGRVWTDAELRNRFGLDDAGVSLYLQARKAIDASLDEVAASEAYALAQSALPKDARRSVIDDPQGSENLIVGSIDKQIELLTTAIKAAKKAGNEQFANELTANRKQFQDTKRAVEKVFTTAKNLKAAGYAPLMRFGKFWLMVQAVDPETGSVIRDENGESQVLSYEQFETEAEYNKALAAASKEYDGKDDVKISGGSKSQLAHKLYEGISPETLALFAEVVGADEATKKFYESALSERSALKRRLERKGTAGYSEDLPRVLSNFITSNGRHAAQRYYLRDLNRAIKRIPNNKGDVLDEAIKLKEFVTSPDDAGAVASSMMFAYFLGGSVASAAVNLTQPIMMTAPYLSQFGVKEAALALWQAIPKAIGKKELADPELRAAIKRASQEGIVDAQEIFHLYNVGAQSVATGLVSTLARVPGIGSKVKDNAESMRARAQAFGTLWGSMFSVAESFNRRLTFIAAWNVAKATDNQNPYAFAVLAVNKTQGIYNKVNRPNWARTSLGRTVLTFKQYSLMYLELLNRLARHGGPEGKRAVAVMLGVLMLAAGQSGLPFAQDLDDLIDTIGQLNGYDTNMERSKRRWAHELLGKELGDFFLYGVSAYLPGDLSGRLGMGNLVPGTAMFKPADAAVRRKEAGEVIGPLGSLLASIGDAYDAAVEGANGKAVQNVMPKAVKDAMAGLEMATKGYATDTKGRKVIEVDKGDAAWKAIGFTPTKVAEESRATGPIYQDVALQKRMESSIVAQWAQALADGDTAAVQAQAKRMEDWNKRNPDTPIQISADQIRNKARQLATDKRSRVVKMAPKEMRGRVGLDLAE